MSLQTHTQPSAPIRTAVLGYGFAGRVFHCPYIAAVPGLELAAVVTSNPERAAAATAAYPGIRVLNSPAEAFADPTLDLIVVATPNDSHFDLASQALQAGKHVVVDKPLTTDPESARQLVELSRSTGRTLAPFHNRRFDNDFLTVRQLLEAGTLGRIATVHSHYDRFRPLQRPNSWKETGGIGGPNGLLYDLGPHLVDQAIALFGTPTRLTASVRADRDQTEIDDSFHIALDFNTLNGHNVRYTCSATMLAADPSPRFRVHGTHGSYTKNGLDPQEAALLHQGLRPPVLGSPDPWLPEPESAWGTLTLATRRTEPVEFERRPFPSVTGDYRRFYASVRDTLTTGAPLTIPAEDAYRTLYLLDLALQSSRERRTLDVSFAL